MPTGNRFQAQKKHLKIPSEFGTRMPASAGAGSFGSSSMSNLDCTQELLIDHSISADA